VEVPTHIPNGRTKDVAMEMPNLSVEGKFVLTFQMEGVQNFTPLIKNIKGPKRSTYNNI
jgi:hypothetical protein